MRTTVQVTPAAKEMMRTMKRATPRSSRTVVTTLVE